jgi:hypothetical protein
MPLLVSLADIRDVFIIIYGLLGIIFFIVAIAVTIGLYLAVKALLNKVNGLIDDSVKPVMGSIREAADTVRGTTDFMGRTAVRPIARTYGTFAGVRQGFSILAGLKGRKRSRK